MDVNMRSTLGRVRFLKEVFVMDTKSCTLRIVGGPNAGMLVSAFRHAYNDEANIKPIITTASGSKLTLDRVIGLYHESGDDHRFIVDASVDGERRRFFFNTVAGNGHFLPLVEETNEGPSANSGLSIVDGPNVGLLASAFLYAYSDETIVRIKPTITVVSGEIKMKLTLDRVVGLYHESGNDHQLIITAYIRGKRQKFYYDAEHRKGTFI